MVQILCPNEGWIYKFRDYEGNEDYLEEIESTESEDPLNPSEPEYRLLAGINDAEGYIVFQSDLMDEDFE